MTIASPVMSSDRSHGRAKAKMRAARAKSLQDEQGVVAQLLPGGNSRWVLCQFAPQKGAGNRSCFALDLEHIEGDNKAEKGA